MNTTEQNLEIINQVEAGLSALEEANKEVPDFSTPEGYARAKELRKPLVKARTTGDKARLAATSGLREQVKSINSMWSDKILPRIAAMEDPLTAGIKAVDEEKARIEREAAEKEQARIDSITTRIDHIKATTSRVVTLEQCAAELLLLDQIDLKTFDEFDEAADEFITEARNALSEKKSALESQAAEAARLAEQKAEQDRVAAEQQAEKDRIEAERRELEKAKEAESRRQAIAEAERKAAEKAEREKREATERAEKEKAEAVEKARLKAIEDEQNRLEAEKQKEAAEQAERERLAALAPDAEKLRAWFDSLNDTNRNTAPEMSTDHGIEVRQSIIEKLEIFLQEIEPLIEQLEGKKAA